MRIGHRDFVHRLFEWRWWVVDSKHGRVLRCSRDTREVPRATYVEAAVECGLGRFRKGFEIAPFEPEPPQRW